LISPKSYTNLKLLASIVVELFKTNPILKNVLSKQMSVSVMVYKDDKNILITVNVQ